MSKFKLPVNYELMVNGKRKAKSHNFDYIKSHWLMFKKEAPKCVAHIMAEHSTECEYPTLKNFSNIPDWEHMVYSVNTRGKYYAVNSENSKFVLLTETS